MHRLPLHGVLTALSLTLLTGCGGSNGGLGDDNVQNACGAATAISVALPSALPVAVPPGGAAIRTEAAFAALTFARPLALQQAPGDSRCWFVAEQAGRVLTFQNDNDVSTTRVFIDISSQVDDGPNEAGLLGMAFHPDYARNRQVFLSYTGNDSGLTSYVSRFTSNDDGLTLDPDSEEILLTLAQPYTNHNAGHILFGPDGYLYITFGDGGLSNDPGERAQNTLNLFGAMLRIDVDGALPYAIPANNPFAGNARCSQGFGTADCPEIYAWGLRNPWRWSFDSLTGELWLGDVGQSALEEIDIIDRGGNYGWPFFEGTRCNTEAPVVNCNFVGLLPITEYPRTEGTSVTGGYIYRGTEIPDLVGVYVYADFFPNNNLFQYFDSGSSVIRSTTDTPLFISSFGEAANGELYLTDLVSGKLHKLVAD